MTREHFSQFSVHNIYKNYDYIDKMILLINFIYYIPDFLNSLEVFFLQYLGNKSFQINIWLILLYNHNM